MYNSFIALVEAGLTLADLLPFFYDPDFRARVMERVKHPIARQYFQDEFDTYSVANRNQKVSPITNKLRPFLANDNVRQMLSTPKSSFNIREAMDTRKILLLKMDKGQLQKSAYLLGALSCPKSRWRLIQEAILPNPSESPSDCTWTSLKTSPRMISPT